MVELMSYYLQAPPGPRCVAVWPGVPSEAQGLGQPEPFLGGSSHRLGPEEGNGLLPASGVGRLKRKVPRVLLTPASSASPRLVIEGLIEEVGVQDAHRYFYREMDSWEVKKDGSKAGLRKICSLWLDGALRELQVG